MKNWNRLEVGFFIAFLVWCAAGLIFTLGHVTTATVATWPLPGWLLSFVDLCLRTGDPVLIFLAFANTHLNAGRQWSPLRARRWGLLILTSALGVETLGATTGFPFGVYRYTDRFGPLLGAVPFSIPLAWHVVVTNVLLLVRAAAPQLTRWQAAARVGALCTVYDFVLEPFATRVKNYWIWENGRIPVSNYLAWFLVGALLTGLFGPKLLLRFPRDPRPAFLLALTILIFLAGLRD